jgi:hypothetical protein
MWNVLFVSNMVPWFLPQDRGCMYWSWYICVEMQLFLLIPLAVIVYMKKRWVYRLASVITLLGGTVIVYAIWYSRRLNVAVLSFEDYYLFSDDLRKPYTKFIAFGFGMIFVDFYIWFDETYREKTQDEKKKENKILHFLEYGSQLKSVIILVGLLLMGTFLVHIYCPPMYFSNAAFWYLTWSNTANAMWGTGAQWSFLVGIMLVFFAVMLGKANFLTMLFGNYIF